MQCVNEWVWLYFNKTLFLKLGEGPDLIIRPSLLIPDLENSYKSP